MSFYTEVIQKHPLYRSPTRIAALNLLEPVTRAAVIMLMDDAKAMQLPLMLFETYRSQERQYELYQAGATQLSTVGVHHYGLAADLVRLVDGKPSWNVSYTFMADLARKHGLVSGVDWGMPGVHNNFVDADHVQRVAVVDQPKLFAASWFPDERYSPYIREV